MVRKEHFSVTSWDQVACVIRIVDLYFFSAVSLKAAEENFVEKKRVLSWEFPRLGFPK